MTTEMKTFFDDKQLRRTFIGGTIASAGMGSVIGSIYSIMRNDPPLYSKALKGALGYGVVGAVFFAMRQTIYQKQIELNPTAGLEVWQTRQDDAMIASTVAGMVVGTQYSMIVRGIKGLPTGLVASGAICAAVQWCINKFEMARIRDVTPMIEHSQQQTSAVSTTTTSTGESLRRMGVFEYYGGRTKQFFSRKFEDITSSEYSPLQRIPDDEYRDMMSKKLITIEVQLDELDQRIAHVENERQKLLQVMNKQE